MKRSLRKREHRIHQSSYHKYVFLEARMVYKKAINSQKANFYEQKFNACGSNQSDRKHDYTETALNIITDTLYIARLLSLCATIAT